MSNNFLFNDMHVTMLICLVNNFKFTRSFLVLKTQKEEEMGTKRNIKQVGEIHERNYFSLRVYLIL